MNNKLFYINGSWVNPNSNDVLDVINPATEEVISQITLGNETDLNLAVQSAKNAFSDWSATTKDKKINYLKKLKSIYERRFDEMTSAIITEMGCPHDFTAGVQSQSGLDHLKDFISQLENFKFETDLREKSHNRIFYEPIGVCGLITPWN